MSDKFGPTINGIQLPENITLPPEIVQLLPWMKLAELKCTIAAIAKFMRVGDSEPMTLSEFEQMTGMARASVVDGLKAAMERGILQRHEIPGYQGHTSHVYSMRIFIGSKIEPMNPESLVKDSVKDSVNSLLEESLNLTTTDSGQPGKAQLLEQLAELGVQSRPAAEIAEHPQIGRYIAIYSEALACGYARSVGWLVQAVKQNWDLNRIQRDIARRKKTVKKISAPQLPEKIITMLQLVGWADDLSLVEKQHASNPDLVEAWLYRVLADNHAKPALEFRGGVKSGLMPKPVDEYRQLAIDRKIFQAMGEVENSTTQELEIDPEPEEVFMLDPETEPEPETEAERIWHKVKSVLDVPRNTYYDHIEPLRAIALNDDTILVVQAGSIEECAWLASRINSAANHALSGVLGKPAQVNFVTGDDAESST